MIEIEAFGERIEAENVVFDLNGTLAVDGRIPENIKGLLSELSNEARVFILTSDTFGTAKDLGIEGIEVIVLDPKRSASIQKREWIEKLGPERTVAVGNGYNDHLMLSAARLGIAVCWREGACLSALEAADIVVTNPEDAIELLLKPARIKATTRD